jgi:hypothetical protein
VILPLFFIYEYTGLFKMIVGVWPSRSPNATLCDFFLWGYVKDQVYVPPLPANISELKVRIGTATGTITADMQTVWNELDYRVDVCRITKCAHIEHLYGMSQKLGVLFF